MRISAGRITEPRSFEICCLQMHERTMLPPSHVLATRVLRQVKGSEAVFCAVIEANRLTILSNRPGGPCKRDVPDRIWPASIRTHAILSLYRVERDISSGVIFRSSSVRGGHPKASRSIDICGIWSFLCPVTIPALELPAFDFRQ